MSNSFKERADSRFEISTHSYKMYHNEDETFAMGAHMYAYRATEDLLRAIYAKVTGDFRYEYASMSHMCELLEGVGVTISPSYGDIMEEMKRQYHADKFDASDRKASELRLLAAYNFYNYLTTLYMVTGHPNYAEQGTVD